MPTEPEPISSERLDDVGAEILEHLNFNTPLSAEDLAGRVNATTEEIKSALRMLTLYRMARVENERYTLSLDAFVRTAR